MANKNGLPISNNYIFSSHDTRPDHLEITNDNLKISDIALALHQNFEDSQNFMSNYKQKINQTLKPPRGTIWKGNPLISAKFVGLQPQCGTRN
uniref:Uncharacterized protein n=1 Tax=Megaselia scalaris TaxID=36166 RepID=T1H372_MEGSC